MTLSDRSLIEQRLELLFIRDAAARLLYVNEPCRPEEHPDPAPLVYVGAGAGVVVCGVRQDVPEPVSAELGGLAHRYAEDRGRPPLELIRGLRMALEPMFAVGALYAGPAYRFPQTLPTPTGTVLLDSSCAQALRDGFDDLAEALGAAQPCVAALVDGRAVAVCQTVRRSAHAVEAGLDTLPAYRRQGHGSRALLHWAGAVRRTGMEPLYSASWENQASCGLARKLGLIQYGTDLDLWEQAADAQTAPPSAARAPTPPGSHTSWLR
jgi:GNAT superfamily N-acetyltransferase